MMYLIQRIDLFLLLVSILLFYGSFTNASQHQLKSEFIEEGFDKRELQVIASPPPNDECSGAIVIPSDFPGDTYTTPGVSIDNATKSINPVLRKCSVRGITRDDVWYKIKPTETSVYTLSTNQRNNKFAVVTNFEMAAVTCENLLNIDCRVARPTVDQILVGGQTYYIVVQPILKNVTGLVQLTIQRRRPPPNSYCINATVIKNPFGETFFSVDDGKYGTSDPQAQNLDGFTKCSTAFDGNPKLLTFWYEVKNPLAIPLSVDVAVNTPSFNGVKSIGIIESTDCNSLKCVGGFNEHFTYTNTVSHDFIAVPGVSYYILLKMFTQDPFNVTIKGQTQYFTVTYPTADKAIQLLRDNLDYFSTRSASMKLNIQARFTEPPESIKSVRLTYDDPKRSVCDQKAPYNVFTDMNGDDKNATIALGQHRVTATPYAQPNCMGKAGTTTVQDFRVTGCYTYFEIRPEERSEFGGSLETVSLRSFTSQHIFNQIGEKPTKLPVVLALSCKITLDLYTQCSFPIQKSVAELRNASSGKLILSKEYIGSNTFPGVIVEDNLAPGSYSIRAVVDNVRHPTINFTVVDTRCD